MKLNMNLMITRLLLLIILFTNIVIAQKSLDFFISSAERNSPALSEFRHLQDINQLQAKLNAAENSAFQVSVSGDYLFAPYFNNHGDLISTNPSPEAIGYDINLFDGGLYSAQLNLERNLFNGKVLGALDRQVNILNRNYSYQIDLEKHNLVKEVTDQFLTTFHSLQLMHLQHEVILNLQEELQLTSDLVKKGYAKSQDYLLLKIELENQKINENDAKNAYRSNLLQLYSTCGIADTSLIEIAPAGLKLRNNSGLSQFIQKYDLDSLSLVNQQELFEIKYQPQLKVFANTGLNAVELNRIQRRFGMSAGVNLSLALFDGNQKSLTRQQNQLNLRSVAEYRSFTLNTISHKRRDLVKRIKSMKQNLQSLDGQVADYQTLLDVSGDQLKQGDISMIDYLTMLRSFTDLRERRIELETNYQLEINNYNYWNW